MALITFIHPDGSRESIDAPDGDTVMEVAFDAEVEGILGECGGSALCATCHVYVDEAHRARLPAVGIAEDGMLDTTASQRRENSRLSCQIPISDAVEGAEFEIPERQ